MRRDLVLSFYGLTLLLPLCMLQACGGSGELSLIGAEGSGGTVSESPETGGSNFGGEASILFPEPNTELVIEPIVELPGAENEPPYEEPVCPQQPPPINNYQCQPFSSVNDCAEGFGCVPYLVYPVGDRCAQASYGSYCAFAGTSTQGDFCGEEGKQCAAGFLCVVGAVAGRRCAQICEPGMNASCSAGLICGETDAPGFGVCN